MLWSAIEVHSEKRGDELRDLIQSQYSNAKPAQLQVLRELKQKIPMDETQAAKVFQVNATECEILIVDNRAVLSVKGIPPGLESRQEGVEAGLEEEREKKCASSSSSADKG